MSKQAPLAIGTVELANESIALLGLVLNVNRLQFVYKFVVSVSKLTFGAIPAVTNFNPVFTQLSFKFSPISFQVLHLIVLLLKNSCIHLLTLSLVVVVILG